MGYHARVAGEPKQARGGDGEVLLTATVGSGCSAEVLGCLGALAIIPLVAVVVNLFAGDKLPPELEGSTPWFLGAALVLGAITLWYYFHIRSRVEVVRTRDGVAIRVQGDELVREPFRVAYGFERHKIKSGVPATTILVLRVIKDDRLVVSFSEEWGAIHGTPDWPQGWPKVQADAASKGFKILGVGKFLPRLLEQLDDPRNAR